MGSDFLGEQRLCRYLSRPAIPEQRLSLTSGGKVRQERKTPLELPAY
jgi:hypothetical protein